MTSSVKLVLFALFSIALLCLTIQGTEGRGIAKRFQRAIQKAAQKAAARVTINHCQAVGDPHITNFRRQYKVGFEIRPIN